jgi:cytochrome P450
MATVEDAVGTRVPTGPKGSYLLGMLRELRHDQLGVMRRAAAEHGDVAAMTVGPPGRRRRLYLVNHPDGVQRVLAGASARYVKGTPIQRQIAAVFGDGMLTSLGDTWLRQRRTLAPLFTPRRTDDYVAVMSAEAVRMIGRWTVNGSARIDLRDEMTEYALRVVGLTLFGDDLDGISSTVRDTLPALSSYALRRGLSPLRLPAAFPTTGQRRAAAARRAMFDAVDTVIAGRRREGRDGTDLVSMLLAIEDPQTGAPLTDREIRDQVLIFLLAGHETTATALTFACHLLGRDDIVQQRIRAEAASVLADRPQNVLPGLRYTAMAVKETMRLVPPAHSFARISTVDDVISGYRIPAGATVFVSPWVTHRRPDLWPDPDRFDPHRFAPELSEDRHRYAYFPFGGGPRGCIGNHFAQTEAVVATALVVAACRLRTEPGPISLATGITVRPAGPVPCHVTPVRVTPDSRTEAAGPLSMTRPDDR